MLIAALLYVIVAIIQDSMMFKGEKDQSKVVKGN
jgi:hypothetical protein